VSKNEEGLIGYFSLDPNRVLDIILDAFMNFLWNQDPYLILLRDYKGSSIAQVLGFKFHAYYEKMQSALIAAFPAKPAAGKESAFPPRETLTDLESKIPKSLLLLTAILVANNMVSLEDIWPHLSVYDETGKEDVDEVENLLNRQIKLVQAQYSSAIGSAVLNKEAHEKKLIAE
jgi:THO complex subunit 2